MPVESPSLARFEAMAAPCVMLHPCDGSTSQTSQPCMQHSIVSGQVKLFKRTSASQDVNGAQLGDQKVFPAPSLGLCYGPAVFNKSL